jgi:two-component system, cell cycle response regulator
MAARILVIEDNQENLELMTYLLTAFGHTTMKATDGEEGVRLAMNERPDLVLCDVQMPRLDGFGVARRLRSEPRFSDVPIVAVTAYAMRDDREKVMAAGFDGYIAKPIVPEEFVSRTEEFLKEHLRSSCQPATTSQAPSADVPRPVLSRARILAVDDLRVNLNLIRSTLEPSGYQVTTVETVNEALQSARQNPPDLILSDVHIPQAGGYQFLAAVKEDPHLRDIPFVLMSSSVANASALADGLALGASKVIFRPLEPELLLKEIESCLTGKAGG